MKNIYNLLKSIKYDHECEIMVTFYLDNDDNLIMYDEVKNKDGEHLKPGGGGISRESFDQDFLNDKIKCLSVAAYHDISNTIKNNDKSGFHPWSRNIVKIKIPYECKSCNKCKQ